MKLTEKQIALIAKAKEERMSLRAFDGYDYHGVTNRGNQTKDAKNIATQFENEDGFLTLKKVSLVGDSAVIFKAASQVELEEIGDDDLCDVETVKTTLKLAKAKLKAKLAKEKKEGYILQKDEKLSKTFVENFKGCFECYKAYNSEVIAMRKRTYKNKFNKMNVMLEVEFLVDNFKSFYVEFPWINDEGILVLNSSYYGAMFQISNKEELVNGTTTELKLIHPYTWMAEQSLIIGKNDDGTPKYYDDDIFKIVINGKLDARKSYRLSARVLDAVRNRKEYTGKKSDDDIAPIIYIDPNKNAVMTYGFKENILFDFSYKDCVAIEAIPGIDRLTGSTSIPMKRAKIAAGWHIVGKGANSRLVPKDGYNDKDIESYASALLLSKGAFMKTSAKRNNSTTLLASGTLVEPQSYCRKFTTGLGLTDKTLNTALSTLFVAKIELGNNLPKELIELGFHPNINDCFAMSESTSLRMEAIFRLPKAKVDTTLEPIAGSKIIGDFRDKGSITSLIKGYRIMVDYETKSEEEADRLATAIEEMRNDDNCCFIDGNIVTFEIDIVANPSTGRDNVAALVTQSCLEQECILEGKTMVMSPKEVGELNVPKLLEGRSYNHRVYIVDEDDEVVYDFGKTAILVEDFFWQPKHDNRFYIKWESLSLHYAQAIDGMHNQFPLLYKAFMRSVNLEKIQQHMSAAGLELLPVKVVDLRKEAEEETTDATKEVSFF